MATRCRVIISATAVHFIHKLTDACWSIYASVKHGFVGTITTYAGLLPVMHQATAWTNDDKMLVSIRTNSSIYFKQNTKQFSEKLLKMSAE